ncbi:MAG: alpha/beta hydrolase [Alphaproteobacteria bacterium]|nr:alpha/beta hydrolase [Alphaproteobacteria bacterium]
MPDRLLVAGRRLECAWFGEPGGGPPLVLLHEGLGSLAQWRDFPSALAAATGLPVFAHSREGYGGSDPCALPRPIAYMHAEAQRLPEVLEAAGIGRHLLYGHSDGASIALIHAASPATTGLLGLLLEAPHVITEPIGLAAIARMRVAYTSGDLRQRLARHHGVNVDCAFRGWAEAWLDPRFAEWDLRPLLSAIVQPVLLLQGEADEYGSPAQLAAIAGRVSGPCRSVLLPDCGHAPHRQRQADVLRQVVEFLPLCGIGGALSPGATLG